jgi:hypothetical protein
MNDFCLSSTQFCYVIVDIRNLESYMNILNRCVPWKIANGAENPILNSLLQVQVILRPTVSRPVCLGVGPTSVAYDQMFMTVGNLQSSC